MEWKEVSLDDVSIDRSYGYTASASADRVGPKFLRITDIVPDRVDWNRVPFCEIDPQKAKKYLLKEGDIVVARTGATTGYNAAYTGDQPTVFASYLIRFRINPEVASWKFISYVLQSKIWYGFVENIKGGSAQPGANANQLGSFDFLLPPVFYQEKIAHTLSLLDQKINLLHRQNQTLEALGAAVFREWFLEGEAQEMPLGEIVDFNYGKSLPARKRTGTGYPVYGSSGITDYHETPLVEGPGLITGRKGTLGIINYSFTPFHPIDTTFYITSKRQAPKLIFEYYLLQSLGLGSMNSDSAVPGLNRDAALSVKIPFVTDTAADKFEEYVSPVFAKIKHNKGEIASITTLRDLLLPKLMSGQVTVRPD